MSDTQLSAIARAGRRAILHFTFADDHDGVRTTLDTKLSPEALDALVSADPRLRRLRHNRYDVPVEEVRLARDYFNMWRELFVDPEGSVHFMELAARFMGVNLARWEMLFGRPLQVPFGRILEVPEALFASRAYCDLLIAGCSEGVWSHLAERSLAERLLGEEIVAYVRCQVERAHGRATSARVENVRTLRRCG